jgi:predicted RNA-binding Zn-ribbon protein involved in translation (DUF1610 family)
MSLSEFINCYGTEAHCGARLERPRGPAGFVCPECGEHAVRDTVSCLEAPPEQVVSGHLPRHTEQEQHLRPPSLKRHLGVSETAAWRHKHKLLEAMRQRESRRLLHGVVFADDPLLGSVHSGKAGRGSENRAPFVSAAALDGAGNLQYVRYDAIDDCAGETLAAWPTPYTGLPALASALRGRQRRTGRP